MIKKQLPGNTVAAHQIKFSSFPAERNASTDVSYVQCNTLSKHFVKIYRYTEFPSKKISRQFDIKMNDTRSHSHIQLIF